MIRNAIPAACFWVRSIERASRALRLLSRHFDGARGGRLRHGIEALDEALDEIAAVLWAEAGVRRHGARPHR